MNGSRGIPVDPSNGHIRKPIGLLGDGQFICAQPDVPRIVGCSGCAGNAFGDTFYPTSSPAKV
ncbi:MAG: hypothetical protein WC054_10260 [Candidatus Nanopelagicales bacterium]